MLKPFMRAAPAVALVFALAATGTANASRQSGKVKATTSVKAKVKVNASVTISVIKDGKLGNVLVDSDGQVLYMFAPDKHARVTCNSECQSIWPPLVAPKTGIAKATDGARQSLVWSVKNKVDGKRIVTYDGWPLYTYVTDQRPGKAGGENLDINGGYWWVIHPNGTVDK